CQRSATGSVELALTFPPLIPEPHCDSYSPRGGANRRSNALRRAGNPAFDSSNCARRRQRSSKPTNAHKSRGRDSCPSFGCSRRESLKKAVVRTVLRLHARQVALARAFVVDERLVFAAAPAVPVVTRSSGPLGVHEQQSIEHSSLCLEPSRARKAEIRRLE